MKIVESLEAVHTGNLINKTVRHRNKAMYFKQS